MDKQETLQNETYVVLEKVERLLLLFLLGNTNEILILLNCI